MRSKAKPKGETEILVNGWSAVEQGRVKPAMGRVTLAFLAALINITD